MFKQLKKNNWKIKLERSERSFVSFFMCQAHGQGASKGPCTLLSQTYHWDPLPSNKIFSLNKGVKAGSKSQFLFYQCSVLHHWPGANAFTQQVGAFSTSPGVSSPAEINLGFVLLQPSTQIHGKHPSLLSFWKWCNSPLSASPATSKY